MPVRKPTGDERDTKIDALMEQFGGARYRCRVARLTEKGQPAHVTTTEFSADLIDEIKTTYGGGRYQVRLIDENSSFVKNGTTSVTIDGPPATPRAVTPAATPTADELADMVLRKLERDRPTSRIEWVPLITAAGAILSPIVVELIKGGRGPANPIAQLKELLEVRELMTGGGDNGPPEKDAVTAAVETFGPILARALDPANNTNGNTGTEAGHVQNTTTWDAMLAPYVPRLQQEAAGGGNPRQLARVVLKYLTTPEIRDMLSQLVQQPDPGGMVRQRFPELAAHAKWLDAFIDETRKYFDPPKRALKKRR